MRFTFVALMAAVVGLAALPASAPAARSCGSFRVHGVSYKVQVLRGGVPCSEAAKTMKAFLSGQGVEHGGRNAPEYKRTWTLPGGWRCGHGTGGGACIRDGANYVVAKDWIKAETGP